MKYPIGVQSFDKIRDGGFVYVDKTELIYKLTQNYQYVFLGRPRRFGKSLLLSTIEAYFEGHSEMFDGLAIGSLETVWTKHPVLHFDLNTGDYVNNGNGEISNVLNYQLSQYEKIYGGVDDTLSNRLLNLIKCAYLKTGQQVVILVDEYDKPILSTMDCTPLQDAVRATLKSFYGCIKSSDKYIRFAMLTGVSKFGKLSVFSDLNNIKDISMLPDYADICGITKHEIYQNFSEPIVQFADSLGVSVEDMVELLRNKYDGYRFSWRDTKVFNPYSLLNAFADKELKDYWFASGTPTFLVNLLKDVGYDLSDIEGVHADEATLYQEDNVSAIPILYQSGYLTIKRYDPDSGLYVLGYPNKEVESGFLNYLFPYYSNVSPNDTKSELYKLVNEIRSGDIDAFMRRLKCIFYSIPYAQDNSAKVQEDQLRNLTYLVFKLIGLRIQVECPMSNGRTDAVIWTREHIYVIEFKVNSTPERAIAQILDRGYAEPYMSDGRKIVLIGVNYSTTERSITDWLSASF